MRLLCSQHSLSLLFSPLLLTPFFIISQTLPLPHARFDRKRREWLVEFGEKNRYVYFTSGFAVVSIPNSTASVRIKGGRDGLIIAADTVGEGHVTKYPSNEETVALLVPTLGGVVPKHSVLYEGGCRKEDEL